MKKSLPDHVHRTDEENREIQKKTRTETPSNSAPLARPPPRLKITLTGNGKRRGEEGRGEAGGDTGGEAGGDVVGEARGDTGGETGGEAGGDTGGEAG